MSGRPNDSEAREFRGSTSMPPKEQKLQKLSKSYKTTNSRQNCIEQAGISSYGTEDYSVSHSCLAIIREMKNVKIQWFVHKIF